MFDSHTCKRIRSIRRDQGIEPEELAAKVGITANELIAYESGAIELNPAVILTIANELGCSISTSSQTIIPPEKIARQGIADCLKVIEALREAAVDPTLTEASVEAIERTSSGWEALADAYHDMLCATTAVPA